MSVTLNRKWFATGIFIYDLIDTGSIFFSLYNLKYNFSFLTSYSVEVPMVNPDVM